VLAQNPRARTLVPPLSRVQLIRGVKVPALGGIQLDSASRIIQAAELAVAPPAQSRSGALRILAQVPRPDTVVTPGTILELTFVGETPPPRPPWIPWVVAVVVAALAGAALMRWLHNRAPRYRTPPHIRPEAHKDFGAPKIETNRKVTIPFAFHNDEETGRMDNFVRAAKALRGEPFENHKYPPYPFDDTDVYKVIEGASYTLSVHPAPKLETYVDGLIQQIAAAPAPDGSSYKARPIDPLNPPRCAGAHRWVLEGGTSRALRHYVAGGEAEAGFVYATDAALDGKVRVAVRVPDKLHAAGCASALPSGEIADQPVRLVGQPELGQGPVHPLGDPCARLAGARNAPVRGLHLCGPDAQRPSDHRGIAHDGFPLS